MPDFFSNEKASIYEYEKEIIDALYTIEKFMAGYEEAAFFINMARKHFLSDFSCIRPDIIVLGSSIPAELIFATNKTVYWVLGGSRISSNWADDLVPRDTDPVSRSSLGYLKSDFTKNALLLVPLVNDSARKLAYLLRSMGRNVHTLYFPPVKNKESLAEWYRQYEDCRYAISSYFKKPLSNRALRKTRERIFQIKAHIKKFIQASNGILCGVCRMFIINSYYYAEDPAEWCEHLDCLTKRLQNKNTVNMSKAKRKVLLLGSPIYFPNYKVPFLIEEAGLEIALQADYTSLTICSDGCIAKMNRKITPYTFYINDSSPAYIKNDTLYEEIARFISENEIDGVVYHILKGQIEYDFELGRFEEMFEQADIPIFRLETDYNYQDVEQLRIRLEAFSEVLNQRTYGKGVAV